MIAGRHVLLWIVPLLVGLSACGSGYEDGTGPPPPNNGEMSAVASAYLDQALNIMQSNSINRLTIDWQAFRAEVRAASPRAQSIADLDAAFGTAIRLLGDGHSSYRSATGAFFFVPTRSCNRLPLSTTVWPARIGYVKVGSFGGTAQQALAFADGIQSTIRAADHDSIAGWIVDLRGNGGGNMWPMVAGLGPIIGEDVVGWFIDPVGAESPWEVRGNGSFSGGFLAQNVSSPYQLRKSRPKVAVLVDNGVASSGEATFIAFIKRPNTRSFGVATCGLSTANRGFQLSDGALLNLTVSTMADRTKFKYGDRVMPDEIIGDAGAIDQRAIAWLLAPN
jgi:C-terminal processing protease CtpA/Prc